METRSKVHTLKKICVSAGKCSEAVLIKTFDAAFKAARREVSERLVGGEKVLTHIQRSAGSREEDIGRYRAQRGLDLGKETHMAWRQGTECTFAIWGSWTRQNGSYVLLKFLEAGRAELAAGIKELHDSETQRGKKKKKNIDPTIPQLWRKSTSTCTSGMFNPKILGCVEGGELCSNEFNA